VRAERQTPSYKGRSPASAAASIAAKAASRKRDTKPELLLRRALWMRGFRYRVDVATLPGRPDIVLFKARLAVFCDGDFWHGRNLEERLGRLSKGHNASYWTEKIRTNFERDRRNDAALDAAGWRVLRFWESEVRTNPDAAAAAVIAFVEPVMVSTGMAPSSAGGSLSGPRRFDTAPVL
jgi:DNA mismatch endonuclease, patch repair protein